MICLSSNDHIQIGSIRFAVCSLYTGFHDKYGDAHHLEFASIIQKMST